MFDWPMSACTGFFGTVSAAGAVRRIGQDGRHVDRKVALLDVRTIGESSREKLNRTSRKGSIENVGPAAKEVPHRQFPVLFDQDQLQVRNRFQVIQFSGLVRLD